MIRCVMIRGEIDSSFSMEASLFENPDTAKYVLQVVEALTNQMYDSIRAVKRRQTSPEEYNAFKRAMGNVTYYVHAQVVEPICRRHPSLDTRGTLHVELD